MASCALCGTYILFGGTTVGARRYCGNDCAARGQYLDIADRVPPAQVQQVVRSLHAGSCPKCNGPGPVDVHTSYMVWSAVFLTSWHSKPQVCCRGCGIKSQAGGLLGSLLLGWWGFPWGILMTPVQIVRNAVGILRPPDREQASPQLEQIARLRIGAHLAQQTEQARSSS